MAVQKPDRQRPTSLRKPSTGAIPVQSSPAPNKGGGAKKFVSMLLSALLVGICVAGVIVKDKQGQPLWKSVLTKKSASIDGPAKPAPVEIDPKLKDVLDVRAQAHRYYETEVRKAGDQMAAVSADKSREIVKNLEEWQTRIVAGVEAIAKVEGDRARKEIEKQKKFQTELDLLIKTWRKNVDVKLEKVPPPSPPKAEPEKPKEEPVVRVEPEPEAMPKEEPVVRVEPNPKEEPKPEPAPPPAPEIKVEPKPEPPQPPERKLEVILADADQLVMDAGPTAVEVIKASSDSLPDDSEKRKALLLKCEAAMESFVKAREMYLEVKEGAPASAGVERKLVKIEKVLALLKNTANGIKSGTK
jgi:hypothetical protein